MFLVPVGVVLIVVAMLFFRRVKDQALRARLLKRAGMALMAFFALVASVWIAAETLMDPGGWEAVGLIAAWLVPLVALGAVAWFRPAWGLPILVALTAAVTALGLWRAVDEGLRDLEDRVGPFTTIAAFAVAAAVAALGHRRTTPAGVMLLVIGLSPLVFALLMDSTMNPVDTARFVVGSPIIVTGVLYVLSDVIGRSARPETEAQESGLRPETA